jgi:hypothetical protein
MVKMIFIPVFALLLMLNACGQGMSVTPSSLPSSGIEGQVTQGPMCPGPVASGDNTCPDQPYQTTISVLDVTLKLVTKFQTDNSGKFKLVLSPGTYILHPESDKALSQATDQTVVVIAGQFTQVAIIYDTGMR